MPRIDIYKAKITKGDDKKKKEAKKETEAERQKRLAGANAAQANKQAKAIKIWKRTHPGDSDADAEKGINKRSKVKGGIKVVKNLKKY